MNNYKLELSKEQMKEYGYKVIDVIVDHFDTLHDKEPIVHADRNTMNNLLKSDIPEKPTNFDEVLEGIKKNVLPNSNITSHPKFYSFVPGPSNYISTIADTIATGFNMFSGGWVGSPAATQVEIVTINWLLTLFNFPQKTGGGTFTSGGSMANLTAIATARNVRLGEDFSKACIYLSDQAHSSNIKALKILGFKKSQIRVIPTDIEFKISINKLKNAIAKDQLDKLTPFCVIASAGTTNTGTIDPLEAISKVCKVNKIWFHVDGAYGGAAILSDEGKKMLKGIEKADSLTIDPHKWMYQPYEIGCLLVRKHKWLSATFSEKPEYLKDIEGNDSEINFYDHGIQLSRRSRALKFYTSIKTFGLDAFRSAVIYNIELTKTVENILRKSPMWEIISPATLAVINFRYNPMQGRFEEKELDTMNQQISEHVINSREAVLVTTILQEKVVLRMCLINPRTTINDIMETLSLCENYGNEISNKN